MVNPDKDNILSFQKNVTFLVLPAEDIKVIIIFTNNYVEIQYSRYRTDVEEGQDTKNAAGLAAFVFG